MLVPLVTLKVIVAPPVSKLLPDASLAWNVNVVDEPDATLPAATETVEVVGEMVPGVTVIVGNVLDIVEPPIVAPIVVADPDVVPVKVAV